MTTQLREPGEWDEFDRFAEELKAFATEQGAPGVMPTMQALRDADRHDLIGGVRSYGGPGDVANRTGLHYDRGRVQRGYWQDFGNLTRELRAFVEEQGTPGVMPSQSELMVAGRLDLANAIRRSGGVFTVGERLGLQPCRISRPMGYWTEFANLEKDLRAFLAEERFGERMPQYRELDAAGRFDLKYAIQRHGGMRSVARRMGLCLPKRSSPRK